MHIFERLPIGHLEGEGDGYRESKIAEESVQVVHEVPVLFGVTFRDKQEKPNDKPG